MPSHIAGLCPSCTGPLTANGYCSHCEAQHPKPTRKPARPAPLAKVIDVLDAAEEHLPGHNKVAAAGVAAGIAAGVAAGAAIIKKHH